MLERSFVDSGPGSWESIKCILCVSWTVSAQDLKGFLRVIEPGVKGRQGRAVRAREVSSIYDWKTFFEPLLVDLHGHTQTVWHKLKREQAAHSFHLVARETAEHMALPAIETSFDETPHPRDIILIMKLYMSMDEPNQACSLAEGIEASCV